MREAGTVRERLYQALIKRYTADQEDALVKIDSLMINHMVMPDGRVRDSVLFSIINGSWPGIKMYLTNKLK